MAQHVLRRDSGIYAKLLRQVSKTATDFVLLLKDIDVPQRHVAAVWFLQSGQRPHQGGLACAIRPQQAIHASRDSKRHVIKSLNAILVGLGKILNRQFHAHASLVRKYPREVSENFCQAEFSCGNSTLYRDAPRNVLLPARSTLKAEYAYPTCFLRKMKLYITLGAPIPISSRLWISARRTTAAVASRKPFLTSSVSVRMWC